MKCMRVLLFGLVVMTVPPLWGNDGDSQPTRDSLDTPPTRERMRTATNAGFSFLNFSFGGFNPVPGKSYSTYSLNADLLRVVQGKKFYEMRASWQYRFFPDNYYNDGSESMLMGDPLYFMSRFEGSFLLGLPLAHTRKNRTLSLLTCDFALGGGFAVSRSDEFGLGGWTSLEARVGLRQTWCRIDSPGRHYLITTWLHTGVTRHALRADLYDDDSFPPDVPVMTINDRIVAPMLYLGVKLQVYCFLVEAECELLHLQLDTFKLGFGWSL